MTPNAYVHLESDTLRIEVDREKKMQVPLHHIGSVVCFGDVMMTPGAMHRCAEDGRSVVLLDRNGRFKARLEGPVKSVGLDPQLGYLHVVRPGRAALALDLMEEFRRVGGSSCSDPDQSRTHYRKRFCRAPRRRGDAARRCTQNCGRRLPGTQAGRSHASRN